MCGIFGSSFFSRESRALFRHPQYVRMMLSKFSHRGPDEQEVISTKAFSLGLARLAIVDAKPGSSSQPIWTEKGRVLAFNGEIYNYRSLAAGSEIRVLAHLLDGGHDPRQYLDGDYAICYYDPSNHKLTLYRDRFGVCPLYFSSGQTVEVSSERRHLFRPKEVPAFGRVVIDLRTGRAKVSQLQHYGAIASFPVGAMRPLSAFIALLCDAVESRARHSDSGFSLALSGGLDSSLIAFALKATGLTPKVSVCVSMDARSEDARLAKMVADACGFPFKLVLVSEEEVHAERGRILEHLDLHDSYSRPIFSHGLSPLKWRGAVRNYFAAAHCESRVLLSGEGADELLGGYPSHFKGKMTGLEVEAKCLSTIRSMPSINLDRTNKLGMAHSVEYRCPYLSSLLSYFMLSTARNEGKWLLRHALEALAPSISPELLTRAKYGVEEELLERTFPKGETK